MEITIRKAEERDMPGLMRLLSEVLELHARIRPDIFISGTTKYTPEELRSILRDENTPVFAAVDEAGEVAGYALSMKSIVGSMSVKGSMNMRLLMPRNWGAMI